MRILMKKNIMIALLLAISLGQMAPVMASYGHSQQSQTNGDIIRDYKEKTNGDIITDYKEKNNHCLLRFMQVMCEDSRAPDCFKGFFDEVFKFSQYSSENLIDSVYRSFAERFFIYGLCGIVLKEEYRGCLSHKQLETYLDCFNETSKDYFGSDVKFKDFIVYYLEIYFKEIKSLNISVLVGSQCSVLNELVCMYVSQELEKGTSKINIFQQCTKNHEQFIIDRLNECKNSSLEEDLNSYEKNKKDIDSLISYMNNDVSSSSTNIGFTSLGVAAATLTKDVMTSYKKEVKKLLAEKQQQAEQNKKLKGKRIALTSAEKARCALAMVKKHVNPKNIKANKMFWAAAVVALGSLIYNKKENFKMPSFSLLSSNRHGNQSFHSQEFRGDDKGDNGDEYFDKDEVFHSDDD